MISRFLRFPGDFNAQQNIGTNVPKGAFLTTTNDRLLVYLFGKSRFTNTKCVHLEPDTGVKYLIPLIIIVSV